MAEPPLYDYISERLQKGKVIPILGAGASLVGRTEQKWTSPEDAFLPLGGELSDYLGRKTAFPSPELELTRVAQYFAGLNGPGGLGDELHEIFRKEYGCGELHELLAELPAR